MSEAVRVARSSVRLLTSAPGQVLGVLCLMYFTLYVDRVNIATAAPLISRDLGLDHGEFGATISAFAVPYAILQLFGGWLADRLGPHRTLALSGLIVIATTMLTGLVGGIGSLIAVRIGLGFGEGAAFPTATRALAIWLPERGWGFAQGLTHGASRLGNAVTPVLVAWLIGLSSWRSSFFVLGAASLVWVGLWIWFFRDDPRTHPAMSQRAIAKLRPQAAGRAPAVPWLRLLRRMLPVTAVDFCYGWTLWVFLTWIPSLFATEYHLDLKHSALFTTGVLLAGVIGDGVGGLVSDWIYRRTGDINAARRNVIVAGMVGGFCFLLPMLWVTDLATAALCLAGACFSTELIVGPIWSVPMDIAPRYAGSASGMMNFGFGCAGFASPWVFGKVVDWTHSWTLPFLGSILLLPLGAGLAFLMRPDRPFEEAGPAQ